MQDGTSRPGPAASGQASFFIRFLNGSREGETVPLAGDRITLGRRTDSTIVVPDSNVSSVHAEIIFEGGVPVIRDLGSTNGVFIEGRRVDEIVLSDRDRVKLGQTEIMVLHGPAEARAAPLEAPLEAKEGDLDEVRVIRDIRGTRRGPGSVILLAVLLLALGASGYYYFFHVKKGGGSAAVEPAKGNLAGSGWSFEPLSGKEAENDVWDLEGGGTSRFTRVYERARSGVCSLKAAVPDGGWAAALRSERLRVSSRRLYKASLWSAIRGDVVVSLKTAFFGPAEAGGSGSDGTVLIAPEEDVGFSRNDDGLYHAVEGVIAPPFGATEMEIRIVAAGRGTAFVDDLEIVEDSSAKEPEVFTSGLMEMSMRGGGFEVMRNKRVLMCGGRIQVVRENDEGQPETMPSEASGYGGGEGYQFAGPGKALLKVAHSFAPDPAGFAAGLAVEGAEGAACREIVYTFDLTPQYAEAGVGLFRTEDYVTFSEAFPPMTANAVMFGGQHERVRVSFEGEARVSGVLEESGGLSVRCHLAPAPRIETRFLIKSDFTADYQEAQGLVKDAARAEGARRYGEALQLIGRIEVAYRFIDSVFNEASVIKGRVLKEKKELLDSIQERLKSAVFLQNPELFNALEAYCGECLALFPADVDFTAALESVRDQSLELRRTIDDERAERYFNIARSLHTADDRKETLAVILDFMQDTYPESEWTQRALELDQETNGQDRNRN
jgi:hypothetical protein